MAPLFAAGLVWLASLVVPSWDQLESQLPTAQGPPVFWDSLPEGAVVDRPVLFRDKQGICPFSEQVWLALEVKNIDYATVLVDSAIETSSWSSPLQLQWPDGSIQTDVEEILERLEQQYPGDQHAPNFYPSLSKAVDSVRCNIVRFKGVFPRNIQENVYAPYLLRQRNPNDDVTWVPESDHMVTLEETDEVLEEYYQGPFLCGAHITAADIVWAPFLERYAAQLPLIYEGDDLTPRSSEYETLKEWYEAMEEKVPPYACRIMGDKATWERLLQVGVETSIVPPVDLLPPRGSAIPTNRRKFNANAVWSAYTTTRPHVAATPQLECVSFYVRNREAVVAGAAHDLTNMSPSEIEDALLEVLATLLAAGEGGDGSELNSLSGNARELLSYLDGQLCTPRDMGVLPAATLRTLALAAPKPGIASR